MKFKSRTALLLSIASTVLAGCSYLPKFMTTMPTMPSFSQSSAPATISDGVLTGPGGMTLYTFDQDEANSGKSTCIGSCAVNWPPMAATVLDSATGEFGLIMRDDGRRQWTFRGKPVHYWVNDIKPGDKTGDGFNKVWRIANS